MSHLYNKYMKCVIASAILQQKQNKNEFHAIYLCVNKFFMFTHSLWVVHTIHHTKYLNNNILCLFNSLAILFFCSLCLLTGTCNAALGMESGAIADFQITASSAHDPGNVGPQHARYVFLV